MAENPITEPKPDPKPGSKDALKAENEALNTENAALKAQLEALLAEKQNILAEPVPVASPEDEKVELFIPKGYANDEPNQQIIINGVVYLLPNGKTSKVPKHVADEFHRSQKAQQVRDAHIDQMMEASK